MSAVGSTETHRALAAGSPLFVGFAAFDAGLVDVDLSRSTASKPVFVRRAGASAGEPVDLPEIEAAWGEGLRREMGTRQIGRERMAAHLVSDIAAPLPHRLESGGLRELAGLTFGEIRKSGLRDMFGLFNDDPRLGPTLQAQLFMYCGLGALASLPAPLSRLLPNPQRFRIAAASGFHGVEATASWRLGMQPQRETVPDKVNDKFAFRLAGALGSHGPGLINALLAPPYNLSRVQRNPDLLEGLRQRNTSMRRVPQAPLTSIGACAAANIALCEIAPQLLFDYPGFEKPEMALWVAADAALRPDYSVLEAFGVGAMMSREKLDEMNRDRAEADRRPVSESLAPFDVDAQGTVVGNGGSGLLITTLEFAMRHDLDVTAIIAGWGQSGETGGKGHFAGVGFGGENALIVALRMALEGHGYSVADFGHLVAHATGTRTNSKTDLATAQAARVAAAEMEGLDPKRLPALTVGAPKAIGDGHTMGETGLKAAGEAIHHLTGEPSIGIPTLRHIDPDLGPMLEHFRLSREPIPGNTDGGVLMATQGFGGFDGALVLRAANADALRRYGYSDEKIRDRYLERWEGLRSERIEREARHRRTRGGIRQLAEEHAWPQK